MKRVAVIFCMAAVIAAFALSASVSYAGNFQVERFVVCTDVRDREPVGSSDTFPAGTDKVYAYLEAKTVTADSKVEIVWLHEGTEQLRTGLNIGIGSRWRTYAYKNLYGMTGQWSVELRDSSGNVLSSATFKVE